MKSLSLVVLCVFCVASFAGDHPHPQTPSSSSSSSSSSAGSAPPPSSSANTNSDDNTQQAQSQPAFFMSLLSQDQKNKFHALSTSERYEFTKTLEEARDKAQSNGNPEDEAVQEAAKEFFGKPQVKNNLWDRKRVEEDLRLFVKRDMQKKGKFTVKDEITKRMRNLTISKVHTHKILPIPDGTHFVCADFKDKNGDKVDVDFFLTPGKDGRVGSVKKVKVHKVNGKMRYTYKFENNVWVETPTI